MALSRRSLSRRDVLRGGLTAAAGVCLAEPLRLLDRLAAQMPCAEAGPRGELVGLARLHGERPFDTPYGTLVGGHGLDARRFTDLSLLEPDRLITPTGEVFIRTTCPPAARERAASWTVGVVTEEDRRVRLSQEDLTQMVRPMGAHLIECAGNADPANFGLISVAEWAGVPLVRILEGLPGGSPRRAVLVSGVDHDASARGTSVPGASWIFSVDQIERTGAFLATRMNGQPLPPDHGAPVRLVVPGWYGCSWIKWVEDIRAVPADAPTTSQMREFARRTHQDGVPAYAAEYEPPAIDLAATPIRVEQRRVDGRLRYRIVGIVWGGDRTTDRLLIRFRARDTPVPFTICPPATTHRMWSLWEYWWQPPAPGTYDIVLKAADPAIRTRRLDLSFYARKVTVDES